MFQIWLIAISSELPCTDLSVRSLFPMLANEMAARMNGVVTIIAKTAKVIIRYLEI